MPQPIDQTSRHQTNRRGRVGPTLRSIQARGAGGLVRSLVAAVLLLITQLVLRVGSVAKARRFLHAATRCLMAASAPTTAVAGAQLETAKRITKDITVVSRRRPLTSVGVDCLAESLVLEAALRQRSITSDVQIGVNPVDKSDAHAWVELDGLPLNDSADVATRMLTFGQPLPPVRA